ncbi:MAG TPA: hypothetical protein VN818_09865 [Gammaproteobacteria bacterium]|nr:hypothetical protein [Gammaproteobacteria bacterium]
MSRGVRLDTLALLGAAAIAAGGAASLFAQAKGSAEAQAAARVDPGWAPPKTPWGHPDLQGIWTTDDMRGIPQQRPPEFGTRQHLTDEEFAARGEQREGARQTQDRGAVGTFRNEEGTRTFGYTSMVVDPADGRIPPVLPEARDRRAAGTFGVGPWNTMQDFSLYDRCITRGVVGSFGPAVYGNGARILQTRDTVVISYEMVHDTRVIPLDGRSPLGARIHQYMGDSRARFEGNTLVIESANFTDKTAIGGVRHSEQLKLTERFTRIDPEMIDYEIHVEDPLTWEKPWTMRMTITQQPGYEIYEYACHEGNMAMRNILSAERAYERAAAEAEANGLPPPQRVFERVNGPDRAR